MRDSWQQCFLQLSSALLLIKAVDSSQTVSHFGATRLQSNIVTLILRSLNSSKFEQNLVHSTYSNFVCNFASIELLFFIKRDFTVQMNTEEFC